MKEKLEFLKLFSDKTRIRIMNLLNKRSVCVCHLKNILGLTQAAVSKHISKLKKAGIIKEEQKSFWTYYSLDISDRELNEIFNCIMSKLENDKTLLKDLKGINEVSCYGPKKKCG